MEQVVAVVHGRLGPDEDPRPIEPIEQRLAERVLGARDVGVQRAQLVDHLLLVGRRQGRPAAGRASSIEAPRSSTWRPLR